MEIESTLISEAEIKGVSVNWVNRSPTITRIASRCLSAFSKAQPYSFADLFRALSIPVRCEFIQLSSYDDRTESSGHVRTVQGLNGNLHNADVIAVEDIVDTGQTLSYLIEEIEALEPASVKVCSLLDKPSRRIVSTPIDYVGLRFQTSLSLDTV